MRILGLLGIYFDAAVHSICHQVFTVVYYSNWFWTHCCSSLTLFVIQIAINYSLAISIPNKPERVFGLQMRCRELDIFKIRNSLEILWIFWGFFGICFGFFGGFFFGGIFGRILLEDFLNLKGIYAFVKILSQ